MRCLSTEQNKCFHLLDSLILYATSLSLLTAVLVKANSIRVSVYRRNKHTTPFS